MCVVEMKHRKTIAVMTLCLVTALMLSTIIVKSEDNSEKQLTQMKVKTITVKNVQSLMAISQPKEVILSAQYRNRAEYNLQKLELGFMHLDDDIELLDVDDIDELLEEVEALPEIEKLPARCIWVLSAKGLSWHTEDVPEVTDAAFSNGIPIGMRLYIRPVKVTEQGILFKVFRGAVAHDGESFSVEGVGVVLRDGRFAMRLEREGIHLGAVGKVYWMNVDSTAATRRRSHPVVMRGRMTVNGSNYVFRMRGRAFRLCLNVATPIPVPNETDE
jgi:hypothetical protein